MRTPMLVIALLALPMGARAEDLVGQADRLFNDLEYDRAIEVADQVLQSPESGPEQLLEAYRIKGLALSGKDEFETAYMVFLELVAIDPQFRISPDISPRLAAPFYQAVATSADQLRIVLEHPAPKPAEKLAGLELICRVPTNPHDMVHSVRLRYRTPARELTGDLKLPLQDTGDLVFRLPADLVAESILYHFEALNQYGGVLVRQGSGSQPHRLRASKAPPQVAAAVKPKAESRPGPIPPKPISPDSEPDGLAPAWYETWWFWTSVGGVVVVGLAVGLGVGLSSSGFDTYTYQIRTQ